MNNRFRSVWFQFFKNLSIVVFLACCSISLKAQSFIYDAFIEGRKIGEVNVVREVNDEAERITLKGSYDIDADSLIQIRFESKSAYMDGILKESESFTKINDRLEMFVSIWQQDEHYAIKKSGIDITIPLLVEELFGLDLFFFEVPERISHAHSLLTGDRFWIQADQNASYLVKRLNTDQRSSNLFTKPYYLFQYDNGILNSYNDAYKETIIHLKLKE